MQEKIKTKVYLEKEDYKKAIIDHVKKTFKKGEYDEKEIKKINSLICKFFSLNEEVSTFFEEIKNDKEKIDEFIEKFLISLILNNKDVNEISQDLTNLMIYKKIVKKAMNFEDKNKEKERKIEAYYTFPELKEIFSNCKLVFIKNGETYYVKEDFKERPVRTPVELAILVNEAAKRGFEEIKVAYEPITTEIIRNEGKTYEKNEQEKLKDALKELLNHYYKLLRFIAIIKKDKEGESKIRIIPKATFDGENVYYSKLLKHDMKTDALLIRERELLEEIKTKNNSKEINFLPGGKKLKKVVDAAIENVMKNNPFDFYFIDNLMEALSLWQNSNDNNFTVISNYHGRYSHNDFNLGYSKVYIAEIEKIINKKILYNVVYEFPDYFSKTEAEFLYFHSALISADFIKNETIRLNNYVNYASDYIRSPFRLIKNSYEFLIECYEKLKQEEKNKLVEVDEDILFLVSKNIKEMIKKEIRYMPLEIILEKDEKKLKNIRWINKFGEIEKSKLTFDQKRRLHEVLINVYILKMSDFSVINLQEEFFNYLSLLKTNYNVKVSKKVLENYLDSQNLLLSLARIFIFTKMLDRYGLLNSYMEIYEIMEDMKKTSFVHFMSYTFLDKITKFFIKRKNEKVGEIIIE
jgi:hypothetical protein